jgi:hypothetical protein
MATRADIKTAILGLLPDNILQDISPLDERDSFDLVIDNFLNIDDNAITNGLTLDGVSGHIKIGGALVENTVIDGNSFSYLLNLSDLSGFNFNTANTSGFNGRALGFNISNGADLNITSVGTGLTNANVAGLLDINPGNAGFSVFPDITVSANFYGFGISSGGGGLTVFDSVDFKGLKRNAGDGASLVWATDNDYYPTIADVKANVSGGGVSITDNYIPIGNATNDGIEDSRLFMQDAGVNDTSLKWSASDYSDTSFFIRGGGGDANNTYLNLQVLDNPGNAFPHHLNTLYNKGVIYFQSRNTNTGSVTNDYHSFRMPNSSSHKVDLYNFGGVDLGTAATWFTCYGGVDYMGHKYGIGADPRVLTVANSYTWASDNNQHFIIGGLSGNTNASGVMNNNNAHLYLWSNSLSPNPEPHLRFVGDYDAALNGAASNNSMYLDAIDSKLHFIGSAGQNIILEDFLSNNAVGGNLALTGGSATTSGSIAIGNSSALTSGTKGNNYITIGQSNSGTTNIGQESIAIGFVSISTNLRSVALGRGAQATGDNSIAIGTSSNVNGVTNVIAIGNLSSSSGGVSLGASSSSSGGVSVGASAVSLGGGISIGTQAGTTTATLQSAISIGFDANGGIGANIGIESIAIGNNLDATASGAIVMGHGQQNNIRVVNNVTDSFGLGWSGSALSFLYSKAGQWLVTNLPTYADDTAAAGGGVALQEIYKTATGELRIRVV